MALFLRVRSCNSQCKFWGSTKAWNLIYLLKTALRNLILTTGTVQSPVWILRSRHSKDFKDSHFLLFFSLLSILNSVSYVVLPLRYILMRIMMSSIHLLNPLLQNWASAEHSIIKSLGRPSHFFIAWFHISLTSGVLSKLCERRYTCITCIDTLHWFYWVYFQQAPREITCHSYDLQTFKKQSKEDAGSIHSLLCLPQKLSDFLWEGKIK